MSSKVVVGALWQTTNSKKNARSCLTMRVDSVTHCARIPPKNETHMSYYCIKYLYGRNE